MTTASTLRLAKEIKGKPEALVTKFTGEQENYTPENIIKAVYDVIDNIDLDPASCEFANKIIKADEGSIEIFGECGICHRFTQIHQLCDSCLIMRKNHNN